MADNVNSALLQQLGERVNIGVADKAVRDKLLMFVGESQQKRVINKTELTEAEAERVKLEPIDEEE